MLFNPHFTCVVYGSYNGGVHPAEICFRAILPDSFKKPFTVMLSIAFKIELKIELMSL